jgi:carboxyl-terminal processing protease
MHAALSFMVSSLGDPHTSYLNPTQYNDLITSLDGEYEGIGAYVDLTGEYVRIISPIKGAPAEEAGLKAGDLVVGVDGEDVTGLDGELVRSKILGPAGSKVVLTIQREGVEDPFDVEITRGKIVIPSVTSEMLDNNIAYVQLLVFGDDTTADLRVALEDLMAQNPDGLILDLRGNGGGYRDVAVSVTSEFLGDGVVLYQEYGDGSVDTFDVIPGGLATDIPLVVLVDEGTASASEILAGAIQDYERGTIVGTTTFGKGTVQLPLELSNSQGVVRITISRWLTPLERQINGVGIEPDHVVEITDADIEAELDPQLDYAIELLTSP